MRFYHLVKQCLTIVIIWTLALPIYALDSSTIENQAQISIEQLYHKLNSKPKLSMPARIDWFSQQFVGVHYELGSLGEGAQGHYDQHPLYRVDAFDCDTYVNTIIALALGQSFTEFKQCLQLMRYDAAQVSYLQRLHFTGLDWNKLHQQQQLLHDITPTIVDKNHQPVVQYATALIEKNKWYQNKSLSEIRINNTDKSDRMKRLEELKHNGSLIKSQTETVSYLPLSKLFPEKGKPDLKLFAQIPQGAIIEIVRPNWDLRAKIGTALNISHLGFAIWKNNIIYFRQASSELGKVVDVPLISYLDKARSSPTIKGINIQIVVPTYPGDFNCNRGFHKIID